MSSRPKGRKFRGKQKVKHNQRAIKAADNSGAGRFRRKAVEKARQDVWAQS